LEIACDGDKSGEIQSEIEQLQVLINTPSESLVPQVSRRVLQMRNQAKQAIESNGSEISFGLDDFGR
jgi:hypothetical protein